MRVCELEGAALDYWVAVAEGYGETINSGWPSFEAWADSNKWAPTVNWADAGPIIEREGIDLEFHKEDVLGTEKVWWEAYYRADICQCWSAATPLIAAMRAFISSKFSEEVSHPKEGA